MIRGAQAIFRCQIRAKHLFGPILPVHGLTRQLGFALVSVLLISTTIIASPQEAADDRSTVAAEGDTETRKESDADALVLGTVEAADGVPVAGAKLWLVGGDYGKPVTLGETTADENGRFAFTDLPAEEAVFANPGQLNVWARHATSGMGWFNGLYNHKRKALAVRLRPVANFQGRLVDSNGRPIVGATVLPEILTSKNLGFSDSAYGQLSPEMQAERTATTDSDGAFVIPNLPASGAVISTVNAKGFGQPRVSWNLNEPVTIKLSPAASLSGTIDWPEGTEMPVADSEQELGKVWLNGYTSYDADGAVLAEGKTSAYSVNFYQTTTISREGKFGWEEMPPGDYKVSAEFSPHVPLRGRQQVDLVLKPGQAADFALPADRAFRITGRVIEIVDRKPVAGAVVELWHTIEGRALYEQRATTDDDGKYLAHAGNGHLLIKVVEAPDAYVPLNADAGSSDETKTRLPTIEVTQDTTWPDLLLDPAGDVEIEVVDDDGEPVPGAAVQVVTPAGYPAQRDYRTVQLTDAKGRYVIRRVALNDTLPICVRTATAISDPELVVTPGDLDGPLQVRVSAEHGFRFRCKVVDFEDEPIANATITIGTSFPYVSKWVDRGLSRSGPAGSFRTDARGFIETGPLWPDRTYWVTASADGYDKAEAPQTSGERGKTVTLEPLVLAKSQLPVVGVVVDARGNPLKGVRVFAAGKAWQMASAFTDDTGNFRLDEIAPDVRYVFADASGYRLGGATIGGDKTLVRVALRRNDAPPRGLRELKTPDRSDQLDTARQLIEQAWLLPTSPRFSSRIPLLEGMVRIDPDYAPLMSTIAGGHFDDVVRSELAKQAIRDDPGRALELLKETRNWRGFNTAVTLGKQLARSKNEKDRETALQLAKFAEELADEQAPPKYYPRLATLFTLLGQHDKARTLVHRTLKTVPEGEPNAQDTWLIQQTAVALAPYDFEQAQALAERAEEGYQRTEAAANVALAIVPTDPDTAIRTVEALKGDSNAPAIRDRARLRIALELVDKDMDRAIQLVRQCEQPGNLAQALGQLAVRVAEMDKQRAWTLIDQALAIHRGEENAYQSWSNFGEGGPFAAALAYQAGQTGYPDMESVIWHVRAACRAKGNVTSGQQRLQATIGTARILALVDQFAARDLLESIADKYAQIPRGDGGVSLYDQWLQAWLLVDFQRGAILLKEDLERLAASGKENPLRYGHGSVFRLLTAAADERFGVVTDSATGLWQLEDE